MQAVRRQYRKVAHGCFLFSIIASVVEKVLLIAGKASEKILGVFERGGNIKVSRKERTTAGSRCLFCGDIGFDMRVYYDDGSVVHWCHKSVGVCKGDHITASDGCEYVCIADDKATSQGDMGSFRLFKRWKTKEEWMEEQARTNPDWKSNSSGAYGRRAGGFSPRMHYYSEGSSDQPREPVLYEEKPLSNEELDQRYRAFLSMLVLEDYHRENLEKEWVTPVSDVMDIIPAYSIKSIPPADKYRFGNRLELRNPTRKNVVSRLVKQFGDLRGIPLFYMRSGEYWDAKPEAERWDIAFRNGGILFPCYDTQGRIYRLRVKDDLPVMEVKKGKHSPYKGKYGAFLRTFDKEGKKMCYFYPEEGERFEVPFGDAYGKVSGKYKNLSSFAEKQVNGKIVNAFKFGTRSGSPCSVYQRFTTRTDIVYLTEGEKKAMVCNRVKGATCVSLPGVNSYNLLFNPDVMGGKSIYDYLVEKGAKYFCLCYDADKEQNETVLAAEQAFANALYEHSKGTGIKIMISQWRSEYEKGLDDILLSGGDCVFKIYRPN